MNEEDVDVSSLVSFNIPSIIYFSCYTIIDKNNLQVLDYNISFNDLSIILSFNNHKYFYDRFNWNVLNVISCGLCSTDIASYNGYLPFPYPLVIGHEIVAKDNKNNKYLIEINFSHWSQNNNEINTCGWCLNTTNNYNNYKNNNLYSSGFHIHCKSRKTIGIDRIIGGISPYIITPIRSMISIPKSCLLSNSLLCICEPLAAAIQAISTTHFQMNDTIGILGPKRLGMLLLVALVEYRRKLNDRILNSITIHGIHRSSKLLSIAKSFGVDKTINISEYPIDLLENKYSIVYDCTGTTSGFETAVILSNRIIHLKSTCGSSCFNCNQWTPFVIEEFSLFKWNYTNPFETFRFAPNYPNIKNLNELYKNRIFHVFYTPLTNELCSNSINIFKNTCININIQYHCYNPLDGYNICNKWKYNENPYPRYDIVLIHSINEIDDIIRPSNDNYSLLNARSPIILLEQNNKKQSTNILENKILSQNIQIYSSRCGNIELALSLLINNKDISKKLEEILITNHYNQNEIKQAINKITHKECIKVIIHNKNI